MNLNEMIIFFGCDGALFYRGGIEQQYVTAVSSDMQDLESGEI